MDDTGSSENKGGGGFFGGGFGAPGVRETKKVSASTEVGIPLQQSLAITLGTAALLFSIYLIMKIFIVDRADWSLLIGILSIVGIPIGLVLFDRLLKNQTPNFYSGLIRFFNSVLMGYNVVAFVMLILLISSIGFIMLGFYIVVIVPQMTFTLNSQAHVVAAICLIIGMLVAMNPFRIFFVRQLTNSLRDSDSKYAIRSLEIEDEWRKRKYDTIEGEFSVEEEEIQRPILVRAPIEALPAPTGFDVRFNTAVGEFLDGIASGEWNTNEVSWKGKRLVRSQIDATAIGDLIRDTLIDAGWAEWVHPEQKHLGWRLSYPIEEIKKRALLHGDKKVKLKTNNISKKDNVYDPGYTIGD